MSSTLLDHCYMPVEIIYCKIFVCFLECSCCMWLYVCGCVIACRLYWEYVRCASRFYFRTTSVFCFFLWSPVDFFLIVFSYYYILQCIHWNYYIYIRALLSHIQNTLQSEINNLQTWLPANKLNKKKSLTQRSLVWDRTSTPNPSLWF